MNGVEQAWPWENNVEEVERGWEDCIGLAMVQPDPGSFILPRELIHGENVLTEQGYEEVQEYDEDQEEIQEPQEE